MERPRREFAPRSSAPRVGGRGFDHRYARWWISPACAATICRPRRLHAELCPRPRCRVDRSLMPATLAAPSARVDLSARLPVVSRNAKADISEARGWIRSTARGWLRCQARRKLWREEAVHRETLRQIRWQREKRVLSPRAIASSAGGRASLLPLAPSFALGVSSCDVPDKFGASATTGSLIVSQSVSTNSQKKAKTIIAIDKNSMIYSHCKIL